MIDSNGPGRHSYLNPRTASRAALIGGALGLLSGCGTLGAGSIVGTRTPVNEAVATTARQQTLMNIVRVYHNEPPLILEIVETDENVSVGANASGGVTGVGVSRATIASGMASASDGVVNRYVPLQGQALISQLSSQITVETINALYDSDWPLQSILELAVDRLTPVKDDYRRAEDLLTHMDATNTIALATAKTGFERDKDKDTKDLKNITIQTQAPSSGGGDTLNIYLDAHLKSGSLEQTERFIPESWKQLYSLYQGTQPDEKGRLLRSSSREPSLIELRNSPRTELAHVNSDQFIRSYFGPVFRTRTAIGILKYINDDHKVDYVTPLRFRQILDARWNSKDYFRNCTGAESYIADPMQMDEGRSVDPAEHAFDVKAAEFLNFISPKQESERSVSKINQCVYDYPLIDTDERYDYNVEIRLSKLRRFVLIVVSDTELADTFSSWFDGRQYYSIMSEDKFSQRNLMLLSQFLTIQATSTPTPSLTTVSASGR